MKKVFLDTNVVLDNILARQPFDMEAKYFFDKAEKNELEIYISALTICNIAYIVRKFIAHDEINNLLSDLTSLVHIAPINALIVEKAIHTHYKDFEDAVQYHSALDITDIAYFITRNTTDFIETKLPILTPSEFWKI